MRKTLIFILGFTISCIMNAQITFTKANFPIAGDNFAFTSDTTGVAKNIPFATANASDPWDFSQTLVHGLDYTDSYINTSAVPNIGPFANSANIALEEYGSYVLFSTTNNVNVIGYISGPSIITYNPQLEVMPPSVNLNTGFTNTYSYQIKQSIPGNLSIDSSSSVITNKHIVAFDASGSLITPSGTYDVLRESSMTIDSTASYNHILLTNKWTLANAGTWDTTYSFNWLGLVNNKLVSLLQLDYNNNKMLEGKTWFVSVTTLPNNINTLNTKSDIALYPTMVSDKLYISSNGKSYLGTIYDIYGRQILTTSFNPGYINMQSLSAGIYVCRVCDPSGQLIKVVKIIKR